MTRFSYIAADKQNNVIKGKTDLADRASVIEALTKQNLQPISIHQLKDVNPAFDLDHLFEPTKVKSDHLVLFTRELSAMVGAGVPLLRSLSSIQKHSEDKVLQRILMLIIKDVEGGMMLADALAKHPEVFNDIYVNMVRAGEAAGILDGILDRLASQQEKSAAIRKRIKGAMAYPVVLMVIMVLAFFGLMLFVVPQIGTIIKDLSGGTGKLPGITLFMLGLSGFITSYWYILFPAIGLGVFGFIQYIHTKKGKRWWHTVLVKAPIISPVIRKIAISRFSRTFSALMGAGVAVLESLDITARSVGNVMFEEALKNAAIEVKNGKSLSSVLEKNELFPAIVSEMLSVGEETGQTDTVLVKVADFYEQEVDASIDGLSSIIEPLMIVLMGGMVGLIAASVMLPISQLSQNIQ